MRQPTKLECEMLLPFAPGSAIDIVAGLIAENMAVTLGPNVYVDDQPGGADLIGTSERLQTMRVWRRQTTIFFKW